MILSELLPYSRVVKFDQDISFLDLRSICRKSHDLQIARAVRRCDDHRAECLDLAFDFQIINKFLSLHLGSREFRRRSGQTERAKDKTTEEQRCSGG